MANVFVFGSNLAGRHGKGAALYAKQHYGAEYGIGFGKTGNAYAIPTKDQNLEVLSLDKIQHYIKNFVSYAAFSAQRYLSTHTNRNWSSRI